MVNWEKKICSCIYGAGTGRLIGGKYTSAVYTGNKDVLIGRKCSDILYAEHSLC